jgi:hypothetical protein
MASASRYQAEYVRLEATDVCDFLENAQHGVRTQATHLLEDMARMRWTICADAHTLGHGANADPALHFNIRLRNQRQIHVRLNKSSGGTYYVFSISRR